MIDIIIKHSFSAKISYTPTISIIIIAHIILSVKDLKKKYRKKMNFFNIFFLFNAYTVPPNSFRDTVLQWILLFIFVRVSFE